MVPASNTGAATPIDMGGGNVGSDLRGKLIHDSEAQMRFLAGGSGRNATAAAQAVEPKSAACLRCPRSWTAAEALQRQRDRRRRRRRSPRCSRRSTGA